MGMREYPEVPIVGVGAFVLEDDRVLLVRRGRPPARGKWSVPGGRVRLGESVEAALLREVREECGVAIQLKGLVGVVERIIPDPAGRVRYHYVLIDYLAAPLAGEARAGSDAEAVRWVPVGEVGRLELTEGLEAMLEKALALEASLSGQGSGPGPRADSNGG